MKLKEKNVECDHELWRNYDDDHDDDTLEERKHLEQRDEEFIKRFYEHLSLQR